MILAIIAFILLRTLFLTSLPIVNDEAIYLHWGNDFLRFWQQPAMPLSLQGKQALTAVTLGVAQLFPIDPLVAGRLTSVLLSLLGLWAFISIARRALSKQSVVTAVWLLASSPLLLFFNRLALPDTAVTVSYLWALYLFLQFVEKPTTKISLALGITIAIGWWFKSTALLAIPSLLISAFIYLRPGHKPYRYTYILYTLLSIFTCYICSFFLISLPGLSRIVPLSETGHVFTFLELLRFPWNIWFRNAGITLQMLLAFSSPFAIIFSLFLLTKKKQTDIQWIVILWAILPPLIEIFLAHIYNSRYIIIAIAPCILVFVMGLDMVQKWRRQIAAGLITSSVAIGILLIVKPLEFYKVTKALPAVQTDISQYLMGWSSGWGVQEAAVFLQKKIGANPAIVFVRADSGNPEDGMYVYLAKTKNIRVVPVTFMDQLLSTTKNIPGISYYFVSRGTQMAKLEHRITELARFNKPMDEEFVGIYQLQGY